MNFIPQFLSALHVSNESSRSSSGAQHNILYYSLVQLDERMSEGNGRMSTLKKAGGTTGG